MASKQTYECFVCKKNGFPETRVYLDGKTETGQTIYKNEDMSPHIHKQRVRSSEELEEYHQQVAKKQHMTVQEQLDQDFIPHTIERDVWRYFKHVSEKLDVIDSKLERLLNLAERK
jgi:hypothetical protein